MPYTLRTQDGIVIRNVPDDAPEEDLRRRVAEVRARRDGGTLPQAVQTPADPTAGMSGLDLFRAGAGKALVDTARGAGQLMGIGPSGEEMDAVQARDAALMRRGAAKAGNIAGGMAVMLPMGWFPGANTIAGAALAGAAGGALEPVGSEGSRPRNMARGAVTGGAVQGAVQGGRAVKAVAQPFTRRGKDTIIGRLLTRSARNPKAAMASAASPRAPVSGYRPTLAEATKDPGLAVLQRGAGSASLDTGAALSEQGMRNNAAINTVLRDMAGDETSTAALKAARSAVADPLYEAAYGQTANVDDALVTLLKRPSLRKAALRAKRLADENGIDLGDPETGEITGQFLHYIKKSLDDALDAAKDRGIGRNERAAIAGTRDEFLQWMDDAIPEYGQARKAFAEGSVPINQAEVAQYLSDKLNPALADSGALPRVRAETYARALRDADQTARRATGFKGARLEDVMTPEQMKTLRGISEALSARAAADDMARGTGSNTAQNIATGNLVREAGVPEGLRTALGAVGAILPQGIKPAFGNAAEGPLQERLLQALLDPEDAAALMADAMTREQAKRVVNTLIRYGVNPLAISAAIHGPKQGEQEPAP